MAGISDLFHILANVISVYIWICIVRFFLSWSPQLLNNPVGRFICDACDPCLMFFRRFKFTQLAGLDFSPMLAIGVLSLIKNICFSIYRLGRLSIFGISIILISSLWQVISFILNVVLLLSFLRFILDYSYKYRSSFFCMFVDRIFYNIKFFIIRYILKSQWNKAKFAYLIIFLFVLFIKLSMHFIVSYSISFLNLFIGVL